MTSGGAPGGEARTLAAGAEQRSPVFAGLPPRPQPFFGREQFLAELLQLVREDGTQAAAVSGPGGIGKTALAATLAHHPQARECFPDGVLWAGLGLQGDPMGALAEWGMALGKDVSRLAGQADRAQAVRRLIGARGMLLVIDDAGDLDLARSLQCGGPNCVHLLTTRQPEVAQAFAGPARALTLSPLDAGAALDLLATLAPRSYEWYPEVVERLAQACGGLPLAVELLGSYLSAPESRGEAGDDALEERLEKAAGRLGTPGRQEATFPDILRLSLDALPAEARLAFSELGAFAPEPDVFSREAALAVTLGSPETLDLLVSRRLLREIGGDLAVPFALADIACAHTSAEALARHGRYYLAYAQASRADTCSLARAYGQIKWAWAAAPDDPTQLEWVEALANFQQRSGQWRDYVDWAERGLRVAAESGLRHAQGVLFNNLAKVYGDLGQRERAVSYYQRALPVLEEVGNRAELATALSNLGTAYAALGKKERSMVYFHRALPVLEEIGDRYALATTLNNLGKIHGDLGERAQALFYYRRALPILVELGDFALESTTRYNLALMFRALGRLEEAATELRQAVALESLSDHPDLENDSALLAQVERELAAPRLLRWLRKVF